MVVRIRFGKRSVVSQNRRAALALAALLDPAAVMALALGLGALPRS